MWLTSASLGPRGWICPTSFQTVHTRWLQCQRKDEATADLRKQQCCGKSAPSGYFSGEFIASSGGEVGQRAVGFICLAFTITARMRAVCQTWVFAFLPHSPPPARTHVPDTPCEVCEQVMAPSQRPCVFWCAVG